MQLNLLGDNKETKYVTCPCCLGTGKETWYGLGAKLNKDCHICKGKRKIKKD